MLARFIRLLLLNLVHIIITIILYLQNIYLHFTSRKNNGHQIQAKYEIDTIRKCIPNFKKKLFHLVIIADENINKLEDLAQLIIWSLIAGVPFISLYDVTGSICQQEDKLFLEIERKKVGVPGCIKWSKKPDLNGYNNGTIGQTSVVHLLSHSDGRKKITNSVREIVNGNIRCSLPELTVDYLNDVFSNLYKAIPDPEVVLYSGSKCITYGLLPWHIRLSEFVQLSVDNCFSVDNFVNALSIYNKCNQRFGK